MGTGIYRRHPLGGTEEVPQKDIDYWCGLCQFPLIGGGQGCGTKEAIQQCWNESGAVAGEWHKQHECPFINLGQECHCNDFKTIEEAFKVAGIKYGK